MRRFRPGDVLHLHDGSKAEVLAPTEDGRQILARYLESSTNPSLVGTEGFVGDRDVAAFTPAPPGPEWGDKVVVVVHHVPESEESEEGYEAVTMGGMPLGVSITASDSDTAQEALDRLLGALKVFGYIGAVTVEDATQMGEIERYQLEVS